MQHLRLVSKLANLTMYRVTVRSKIIIFLVFLFNPVYADNKLHSEYEAFGVSFAEALSKGDYSKLEVMFPMKPFARKISSIAMNDPKRQRAYEDGFLGVGNQSLIKNIFNQEPAPNKSFKFLRVDDNGRGVIRIVSDDEGYNYYELILGSYNGNLVVSDFYALSIGDLMSRYRGILMRLTMDANSDSFVSRLFGKNITSNTLKNIQKITKYQREGNISKAYETYRSLPSDIRDHKNIITTGIWLSSQLGEDLYIQELSKLHKKYSQEDWAQYYLFNYFLITGNHEAAVNSVNLLISRFGEDGFLRTMLSQLHYSNGDVENAILQANRAIEIEPKFVNAYWELVGLHNELQNYKAAIEVFKRLENEHQMVFSLADFDSPSFTGLKQSSSFIQWIKNR